MLGQTLKAKYGSTPVIRAYGFPHKKTIASTAELFGVGNYTTPTEVGIEVEIENLGTEPRVDLGLWKVVGDDSLRGGIELISHPLKDKELLHAMSALNAFFEHDKAATFTHRCSVHVHINASTMTYEQLLVFMGFYLTVENVFFDALFPSRKGNNYCFPLVNTQLTQRDLGKRYLTKEIWKYAAVNLYHLRDYGTLEFRQHPGTRNVKELLQWIETILCIYNYAQRTKFTDFVRILDTLNTTSGYTEYVRSALPTWTLPINTDNMYDAVTAAKFFLFKQETA